MQWSVRPFARLIIFYILGILAANKLLFIEIRFVPTIAFFVLLLAASLLIIIFFNSYKNRWIAGMVFYGLSFFAGFYNLYFTNKPLYKQIENSENKTYIGEIISGISFTDKSLRFELIIHELN